MAFLGKEMANMRQGEEGEGHHHGKEGEHEYGKIFPEWKKRRWNRKRRRSQGARK